tara:strand:- start:187 stop:1275 length:1089 start_codon:yes stop_codon:yes gene_type:complete
MKNSIVIITGGTGGHVIPAEIFFNYISSKNENTYLISDKRGFKYIKDKKNLKIFKINASHFSGNLKFKIYALIKLFVGFFQSIKILYTIKPKIVISFGSYASFTPLLCVLFSKKIFKTELYIHEQNSVIGQVNKIFLKFSNKIFLNFEINYNLKKKFFKKLIIVGLPQQKKINKDFVEKYNSKSINFLVFAGSQGSLEILDFLKKILSKIELQSIKKNIKFIIQCPLLKQNEIKNLLTKKKLDFQIKDFFKNFEEILSDTHIALCRSGAGTINDLIKHKIPAILCPLSHAKDNHQYENAKVLSDTNCAIILDSHKINFLEVTTFIIKVIDDKNFNKSLITNYNKIKIHNANELMWNIIKNEQ